MACTAGGAGSQRAPIGFLRVPASGQPPGPSELNEDGGMEYECMGYECMGYGGMSVSYGYMGYGGMRVWVYGV